MAASQAEADCSEVLVVLENKAFSQLASINRRNSKALKFSNKATAPVQEALTLAFLAVFWLPLGSSN